MKTNLSFASFDGATSARDKSAEAVAPQTANGHESSPLRRVAVLLLLTLADRFAIRRLGGEGV